MVNQDFGKRGSLALYKEKLSTTTTYRSCLCDLLQTRTYQRREERGTTTRRKDTHSPQGTGTCDTSEPDNNHETPVRYQNELAL